MKRRINLGTSQRQSGIGRFSRAGLLAATIVGSFATACSGGATPPPQTAHARATRVDGSGETAAVELASKRHMADFARQLETALREPTQERVAALAGDEFAGLEDAHTAIYVGTLIREAAAKKGDALQVVRIVDDGPEPRVVTRKDTADGHHVFLGWMVTYDVNGKPHLSDLRNYSRGVSASGNIQDANTLLRQPLPIGVSAEDREKMLESFAPGTDPQTVLNTYAMLPPEYKADRFIQLQWVPAASALAHTDDTHAAVAADALSKWAHQDRAIPAVDAVIAFNDAGDTDRALEEFRAVERQVGPDPVLDLLHADVALGAGRLDEARAFANRARQAVPNYEEAYWTLVATAVEGKQFDDAVRHLRTLRDGLDVETVYFDGQSVLLLGPKYQELLESKQYKAFAQEGRRAAEQPSPQSEPRS